MRVRDLMSRGVITVRPEDTVSTAKARFRERDIHHLLVVDQGVIAGVLTPMQLHGRNEDDTVADAMTRGVPSVDPDTTIRRAASLMISATTGCLPVMEGGTLAGILTASDLRRAVGNPDDTLG